MYYNLIICVTENRIEFIEIAIRYQENSILLYILVNVFKKVFFNLRKFGVKYYSTTIYFCVFPNYIMYISKKRHVRDISVTQFTF